MKAEDIDWIEPNEASFDLWESERSEMRWAATDLRDEAEAYIRRTVNRHRKPEQSKIYSASGVKKSDCPDNVREQTRRKFQAYVDQYEEAEEYLRNEQVCGCPPQFTDNHPTLKKMHKPRPKLDVYAEQAYDLYNEHRWLQLKIKSLGARLYVTLR